MQAMVLQIKSSSIIKGYLIAFMLILLTSCGKINHDTLIHMKNVNSEFVDPRNVDIWLPPGYYLDPEKRYPVLYMHDGQNLFDTSTAYGGHEWGVDEWIKQLSKEKKIPEMIVVGIWNTPKRFREYNPQKPFDNLTDSLQQMLIAEYGGPPLSDAYLQFIVRELKPIIDSTYQTLPDRQHTAIMGSSMGGLISAYALVEYPEVFSRAGCLSTHWPVSLRENDSTIAHTIIQYFAENIPVKKDFKIYFDYGTETLDSWYPPYQQRMDELLSDLEIIPNNQWITHVFEGDEHNEIYWNKRLHVPLEFLLGDLQYTNKN
jgi:predicted alpha/beta superfamily hydrolase